MKQPRRQWEGPADDVDRTVHNDGTWGERVQTTVLELKDTHSQRRCPSCKCVIDRSWHNGTEATDVDGRDRNGNGRTNSRCNLYLGLAATHLVLISSIASSNNYTTTLSLVETTVLMLSSLSFIQTFILGMQCFFRPFDEYVHTIFKALCQYNGSLFCRLRVGFTFEKFAVSILLVNTCISLGMILYPHYDAIFHWRKWQLPGLRHGMPVFSTPRT
jgi:hypothetical protein